MIWKFTIIDRNNVLTVIDEPVGWDSMVFELKRDTSWHGIFFSKQGDTDFEFDDKAMRLIKAEYEQYGLEGDMSLKIEEDCGNGYGAPIIQKFVFAKYEYFCENRCYVKIPVETLSEVMDLRNRINQKVNLQATTAFDETTALVPYNKLPFDLLLPSKGIFIQDYSRGEGTNTEQFNGVLLPMTNTGHNGANQHLEFGFNKEVAAEIGLYGFSPGHTMTEVNAYGGDPQIGQGVFPGIIHTVPGMLFPCALWPLSISPALNYAEGSRNFGDISNPVQLDIVLQGGFTAHHCYVGNTVIHLMRQKANTTGENESDYDFLWEDWINARVPGGGGYFSDYATGFFPISTGTSMSLTLSKGERYYFFISIEETKSQGDLNAVNGGAPAMSFYLDTGSYFKITNLSHTAPTISKVFMVNEAISRIAESITNDKVRGRD